MGKPTTSALLGLATVLLLDTVFGAPGREASQAVDRLASLESRLLVADYRGNLEVLAALRDETSRLASDPEWGYLAQYWSGFASWRLALNGANQGMGQDELREHLEQAATAFEASTAERPDFADAFAAAGSVHGWLTRFYSDDLRAAMKHSVLYFMRTRRALELEPNNPRALWVDASVDLFMPVALGGDPERAVRTYRRMLEVTEAPSAAGPQPDWGRPEAYMSLAFAHSGVGPIDLDAALEEAGAALRLQPEWSYVRDVLLPQIEAARAARSEPGSQNAAEEAPK